MKAILTILILVFAASVSAQHILSEGDKAPLFKAKADDGSTWDLKKHIGKDNIVIYFYPAAMTGGCTKQACAYRDRQEELKKVDAIVVGISGDTPENLKLFRQAENLNFRLVSDKDGEIAKAYGVPVGEGGAIKRTVAGVEHELVRNLTTKRWTFIIGRDGKIIYKNDSVNPEKDTEEVIKFLSSKSD